MEAFSRESLNHLNDYVGLQQLHFLLFTRHKPSSSFAVVEALREWSNPLKLIKLDSKNL